MLIGIDFMSKHQVMVDMKSSQLCLLDHKVQFIDNEGNSAQAVTKTWVRITKRIDIPPQSVVCVPCHAAPMHEDAGRGGGLKSRIRPPHPQHVV